MAERKPIFYDEERRRWRRTRLALEIAGGVFTLILIVFLIDVSRKPDLPELLRPDVTEGLHAVRTAARSRVARPRRRQVAALGKIRQGYTPLRAAFYMGDDPNSMAALQLHYHEIDLLIPEVLHSISADGHPDVDPDTKLPLFLQSLQARNVDLPVMGMINNY